MTLRKKKGKIWIMGGANMDILGTAVEKLLDYDSNPGRVELRFGGVGRNIAEVSALLGDEPRFITCFGKDNYGALLKEDCLKLGMNLDFCLESEDCGTSTYLALMDENHDMRIAMNDMEIIDAVKPEGLDAAIEAMEPEDYLIIDSNFSEEVISHICEKAPCPVAADPVSIAKIDRLSRNLSKISILKPNKIEGEYVSGIEIRDEESGRKILDWFMDRGVKEIAVTMADKGILFGYEVEEDTGETRRKKWFTHRALALNNATGGGDAFLGAYVSRRARGEGPEEAIRFAISAAALNIESPLKERRNIGERDIEAYIETLEIREKHL